MKLKWIPGKHVERLGAKIKRRKVVEGRVVVVVMVLMAKMGKADGKLGWGVHGRQGGTMFCQWVASPAPPCPVFP